MERSDWRFPDLPIKSPRQMTLSDSNKKIVLAYVDAFNGGDIEALVKLFTPDALVWGVLGWGEIEKVRPIWKSLIECLQINCHVESIIAEGDVVAVRYTERGTFVKPFLGHPPTGKSYEMIAMEWFQIKDGLIHRRWGARDSAAQARQIGLPL
jgi:steroid delta-isomerase-like uncharacterized protein